MIEDKELGIKIAESEDEKAWIQIRDNIEKEMAQMKRAIQMNEVLLNFISEKIIIQD